MKRIAVLMTCYNRVKTSLACLEGLFGQRLPDGASLDVFLVDDASPDATGDKVKEAFPSVFVIRGSGQLYWSKGMRLAWIAALEHEKTTGLREGGRYTHFLWVNDDVTLNDDALKCLIEDCDCVGGVVVGSFAPNERYESVSYGATKGLPSGFPLRGMCGMNGNFVLIPRVVYDRVGLICGGYHHQYGDYDYGWMLRRHGFEYYSSSRFCGVCVEQPERYHHLRGCPLWKRLRLLSDPKGYSLHDACLYQYRKAGIFRAFLSCLHIIVKVVFAMEP